jgi:hypothetical protein
MRRNRDGRLAMADWKCLNCGWMNGHNRTNCQKCGLKQLTEEDYKLLEKEKKELDEQESEIKKVNSEISQFRNGKAPKWEYTILSTGMNSENNWIVIYNGETYQYNQLNNILNDLGSRGWELISITTNVGSVKPRFATVALTFTSGEDYFFKRPCPPNPDELQEKLDRIKRKLPNK